VCGHLRKGHKAPATRVVNFVAVRPPSRIMDLSIRGRKVVSVLTPGDFRVRLSFVVRLRGLRNRNIFPRSHFCHSDRSKATVLTRSESAVSTRIFPTILKPHPKTTSYIRNINANRLERISLFCLLFWVCILMYFVFNRRTRKTETGTAAEVGC
jgi:hypothetical protein